MNDDNVIDEINIRDEKQYAGKYLDKDSLEKIKTGTYSDFNNECKVNKRIFNDNEIEILLNFYDKYFEGSSSLSNIEKKVKEFYKDFSFYSKDVKHRLINDIIVTSGKVEYNDVNLICPDCGCKYISSLSGGYLRKRKKGKIKNNNHPLNRHAYGCVITGHEYTYQCLGCGKEW